MVGEIRDIETAAIAVNAALTGHLLLSTLHTNDAATTLPRLLDMKVEPFLIASTVNIAIGQRLVRKLCQNCRKKHKLTISEIQNLSSSVSADILDALKNKSVFNGVGCDKCNNSGFIGRIGIHEVLEVTPAIQEAIIKHFSASQIKEIAVNEGMTTMLEDGFKKVVGGITTIEEVLRVMHE